MKRGAGLIIAVLTAALSGCGTPLGISSEQESYLLGQVRNKDYIVGIAGLGAGPEVNNLVSELCNKHLCGAATAGNPEAHMKIIRAAFRNKRKVFIVAHSLGASVAEALIERCEKEGIEIEASFVMDAFAPGLIHSAARRFYDVKGTIPYMFRGREYNDGDIKDANLTRRRLIIIEGADHFSLPAMSKGVIQREIGFNSGVLRKLYAERFGEETEGAWQQGKSSCPSEIFQNRQRGLWRGGYFSGDNSAYSEKPKQRICKLNSGGYSRAA